MQLRCETMLSLESHSTWWEDRYGFDWSKECFTVSLWGPVQLRKWAYGIMQSQRSHQNMRGSIDNGWPSFSLEGRTQTFDLLPQHHTKSLIPFRSTIFPASVAYKSVICCSVTSFLGFKTKDRVILSTWTPLWEICTHDWCPRYKAAMIDDFHSYHLALLVP